MSGMKTAMTQRPVRTAEGEMVLEAGHADREVGCHAVLAAPELAEVGAVLAEEREAWNPGGVVANGSDYDVGVIKLALLIRETGRVDAAYVLCKYCCVGSDKGFEIARSRCRVPAIRVEVLGDDLFAEPRVVVESAPHFGIGIAARTDLGVTTRHGRQAKLPLWPAQS